MWWWGCGCFRESEVEVRLMERWPGVVPSQILCLASNHMEIGLVECVRDVLAVRTVQLDMELTSS